MAGQGIILHLDIAALGGPGEQIPTVGGGLNQTVLRAVAAGLVFGFGQRRDMGAIFDLFVFVAAVWMTGDHLSRIENTDLGGTGHDG